MQQVFGFLKRSVPVGVGASIALVCLTLILYCAPQSRYAVSKSKGLRSTPVLHRKAEESASKRTKLIDSIADNNLTKNDNREAGSTSNTNTNSEQKAQDTVGWQFQALEDSITYGGELAGKKDRAAARWKPRDSTSSKSGQCKGGICNGNKLQTSDFVFAVASHKSNEPTLIAGRSGRLGYTTYVATNYTESETVKYPSIDSEVWGYYPDDKVLRSFYEGDSRAALVPFLAYRDMGDKFKWLFYGDDDTIFFVDAAMKLVKDLDPEMPYFLSDHFWYSNWNYGYQWHPHWRAPRCLLCNSDVDVSILRMNMTKACPCTPQAMCDLEHGYDGVLDKVKCTPPRSPTLGYSMHGGAGALISIGMLKKVSFKEIEDCVLGEWNTGGDAFITTCLWKAGYGMTDPGPLWHEDGLTHFDPSPRKLMIDHTPYVIPRAAYVIGNMVAKAAGACGPTCQLELDNIVSLHLRARLLTNTSSGSGMLIRGVTRFYGLMLGRIDSKAEDLSKVLHDVDDPRAVKVAAMIDQKFANGIDYMAQAGPVLSSEGMQKRWPADGGAALFVPQKRLDSEAEDGSVLLSSEDIVKGGAAAVMRGVLQESVQEVLNLYPPPPPKYQ